MIWAAQNTEAGKWLRSWSRKGWKTWYRAERIVRRETAKVSFDTMIFGTGFLKFTGDDRVCERIDPADMMVRL